MGEFGNIRATAEATTYLGSIADAMAATYSMSRAEAVARISRYWDGLDFLTETETGLLTHESPDYWAGIIYSGGSP